MAINTSQSTISDYNTLTVTALNTLLDRFSFVWNDQDALITNKIIGFKDGVWKQVDLGLPAKAPIEISDAEFVLNAFLSNTFYCSLTGNIECIGFLGLEAGIEISFIITQDSSGGHTIDWPADVSITGTLNSNPNAVTICRIVKLVLLI